MAFSAPCPRCGNPTQAGQPFCGICGTPVTAAPALATAPATPITSPAKKSPWIAIGVILLIVAVVIVIAFVALRPTGLTGFRVTATDCWSGVFASGTSSQTLDGCNSMDVPMNCSGVYSVYASKDASGPWTLTVQRVRNGQVLDASSTSTSNGIVTMAGLC